MLAFVKLPRWGELVRDVKRVSCIVELCHGGGGGVVMVELSWHMVGWCILGDPHVITLSVSREGIEYHGGLFVMPLRDVLAIHNYHVVPVCHPGRYKDLCRAMDIPYIGMTRKLSMAILGHSMSRLCDAL